MIVERLGHIDEKLFAAAGAAWLVLGAMLYAATSAQAHVAVASGWGLAGGLSALTFAALVWSRRRSMRDLMVVVFGGFLVRLVLVGVAVMLILRAGIDPMRFVLGFFPAYILLQVIEVVWLDTEARQRRASPARGGASA